jgi:hypothetical protein
VLVLVVSIAFWRWWATDRPPGAKNATELIVCLGAENAQASETNDATTTSAVVENRVMIMLVVSIDTWIDVVATALQY